jgi:hypothetical protein
MGELLLKGWRMLGEDCPLTGEVPLMQHPTSGRKFSIAAGQYTDEMDLSGSGAGSLLSNQSANGISPQPATQTNGADATAAPAAQVRAATPHLTCPYLSEPSQLGWHAAVSAEAAALRRALPPPLPRHAFFPRG